MFRAVDRFPVPASASGNRLTDLDIVLTIAVLEDELESPSQSSLNGSKCFFSLARTKEADLRGVTLYSVGCRVDRTLLLSDKATGGDRLLFCAPSSDSAKPL